MKLNGDKMTKQIKINQDKSNQKKTKQNKTKQNKAKQSKTKQNKTNQNLLLRFWKTVGHDRAETMRACALKFR